ALCARLLRPSPAPPAPPTLPLHDALPILAPLLPPSLRALLPPDLERRLPQDEIPELGPLLQIRLGAGRPVELCFPGVSRFLAPSGRLVPEASQAWVPDGNLAHQLLQRAAQGSLYARSEERRVCN